VASSEAAPDLASDRARALALTPVSRETEAHLDRFVALLLDWQRHTNLIASSTEPVLWTRHIADSLQLLSLAAPDARVWVDLGSGAGFPGLVIACALAGTPGAKVHLIESNQKKAAFLTDAARITGAPVEVHPERIAAFAKRLPLPGGGIDMVCARALAPLDKLLTGAYPLLKTGAKGLFLKGQDVDTELTQAAKCWNIQSSLVTSRTNSQSRIVVVSSVKPKR
jgi:16S rRNA (guanine527-N7)-methyltransferase